MKKTIFYMMAGLLILTLSVGFFLVRSQLKSVDILSKINSFKKRVTLLENLNSQVDKSVDIVSEKGNGYEISGNEVIKITNGERTALFTNVYNIKEVRPGPDGKTLHFRLINPHPETLQEICANLESKIEKLPADYQDPPPQSAPWDYKRIAHAYTIGHCNVYYAGGFLKNSDYFVYLTATPDKPGKLILENLKTRDTKSIDIPESLVPGFFDGTNNRIHSNWTSLIQGKDGDYYFYPQLDMEVADRKLVLAFGRLIVAVDPVTGKYIGGTSLANNRSIVATSFYFLQENQLPFVLIESEWEGVRSLVEIIDVSNGNFKVTEISQYDKRSLLGFDISPVVWEEDGVLFNFTNFESATDKLPEEYSSDSLQVNDEEKMKKINADAEEYLKQHYKYIDASCNLAFGMIQGCDGLKRKDQYRYTPETGLIKL